MAPKPADAGAAKDAAPKAAAAADAAGPATARPAARPTGTNGSDHSYRMTVDDRYKRAAVFKGRLAVVCRAHMTLALVGLFWAVGVPWLADKTTVPLPCATAATALFCAASGSSAASGRATVQVLERYAKLARSAIMLGMLAMILPRYTGVPPSPAADAAAKWAAQRFQLPQATASALAKQLDVGIEGGLAFLPWIEWYYAARLRRFAEGPGTMRKKTL